MHHIDEHLAWLLAAEEHPHLTKEEGYAKARQALRENPELKAQFDQALAFARRHPRLVGFERMPGDARARISDAINKALPQKNAPSRKKGIQGPWGVRRQFAWAAVLALLLAGLSVVSSTISESQSRAAPPRPALAQASLLPDFHQFVTQTASRGVQMDHHAEQPVELVQWLRNNQGLVPELPDAMARGHGRGCALVEGPHGKVSVVCVIVEGQPMHLFVACAKTLRSPPSPRQRVDLGGRPAIEWVQDNQVYLLIPEDVDADLPEILL